MATSTGKKARKAAPQAVKETYHSAAGFKEVKPLNFIQGMYLEAIRNNEITFGTGSAGTGKTFMAASYAAGELYARRVNKIILSRPNVESGPGLGFLPGTLEEKYFPYLAPFEGVFIKALGKGFYDYCLKDKTIEPIPIGFMRGLTFDNCIVLVDEAQNIASTEMKMILSRIGKNCKMIFSGDTLQQDIPGKSGLQDAIDKLNGIEGVEVVHFLHEDIVRSRMCKQIIMAYEA